MSEKSKKEPRPSGGWRMQLGFSPYSDIVVLRDTPVRCDPSARAHRRDTMGSLMMKKGSFQLLLMMKGNPNYSASV